MADNRAEYELRLRDLFSGKLNEIERKMDSFEKHFNDMNNKMNIGSQAWGTALGIGLERAFSKTIDLIKETSMEVVRLGTEMEKNRVAFETMLGRGREFSDMMISSFQKFAQATPFSTQEVLGGAKKLTAYGFAAEEIIPTMKRLGDVASGLNINFNDLTWLYGHMKEMPNIDRVRMKQLQLRGIPVAEELQKMKGVNSAGLSDLIHDRKISFKDIEEAFKRMTSEGGRFFNLSEKISLTTAGRWERLKDTVEIIQTKMGEQMNPLFSHWVDLATDFVSKFKDMDMSGLMANLTAVERVIREMFSIFSNPEWKSAGEILGYGFRRTLLEVERLINRIQWISDVAVQIKEHGLITGIRMYTLRQQELDKAFMASGDEFEKREKDIEKSKLEFAKKTAADRLYEINNLYDGSHAGFIYKKSGTSEGSGGEGSGSSPSLGIHSATRNITVNITKLIETVNFTKSYEQSESNLRDMITKALIAEVNNVNQAV